MSLFYSHEFHEMCKFRHHCAETGSAGVIRWWEKIELCIACFVYSVLLIIIPFVVLLNCLYLYPRVLLFCPFSSPSHWCREERMNRCMVLVASCRVKPRQFSIPVLERGGNWLLSLVCPCLADGDACQEFRKFRVSFDSPDNMQWRNVLLWNFLILVRSLIRRVLEHRNQTHRGSSPSTRCPSPFALLPVFVAHRGGQPSPGGAAHFGLHLFLFQTVCKRQFHVLSHSQAFCKIVLCNSTFFGLYW